MRTNVVLEIEFLEKAKVAKNPAKILRVITEGVPSQLVGRVIEIDTAGCLRLPAAGAKGVIGARS